MQLLRGVVYDISGNVFLFYEEGDFLFEIWVVVLSMTLWYVSSTCFYYRAIDICDCFC